MLFSCWIVMARVLLHHKRRLGKITVTFQGVNSTQKGMAAINKNIERRYGQMQFQLIWSEGTTTTICGHDTLSNSETMP